MAGEAEEKITPETTEQVRERIMKLANEAEFGSPAYQAISDYLDLEGLRNSWRIERGHMKSSKDDPDGQFSYESSLRVTDMKIALLEHTISQNRSRIKGYSNAYARMWLGFDELGDTTYHDAREKYPDDKKEQDRAATNVWDQVFSDVQGIIMNKND